MLCGFILAEKRLKTSTFELHSFGLPSRKQFQGRRQAGYKIRLHLDIVICKALNIYKSYDDVKREIKSATNWVLWPAKHQLF